MLVNEVGNRLAPGPFTKFDSKYTNFYQFFRELFGAFVNHNLEFLLGH